MPAKHFGQFLLERGKIIREELLDALKLQKSINVKLGTIALDEGYLNAEDVGKIHSEQQRTDKLFGEIALGLNMLSSEQLEELLTIQRSEHITLGQALVQKGYLTLKELEEELLEYKKDSEIVASEVYAAIRNLKHPEVAESFIEYTIKLLLRMCDIEAQVSASHNDADRIAPHMWNCYQQFYGEIEGTYIISVTDEPLIAIASHVAQEKIWEVDDLAKDSMKEFVNVVVGNSVAKLSHDTLELNIRPSKMVTSLGHIEIPEGEKETLAVTLSAQSFNLQLSLLYTTMSDEF